MMAYMANDEQIEDLDVPAPEAVVAQDPGPDAVDDWQAPRYHFAGTSIAGNNLVFCDRCEALLRESGQDKHSEDHRRTDAVRRG